MFKMFVLHFISYLEQRENIVYKSKLTEKIFFVCFVFLSCKLKIIVSS